MMNRAIPGSITSVLTEHKELVKKSLPKFTDEQSASRLVNFEERAWLNIPNTKHEYQSAGSAQCVTYLLIQADKNTVSKFYTGRNSEE
ncbi:hypothetical protein [Anaerotruncus sp.]|jgi:hypothetical protein|uniref:hypothetical protein n=1 Tax=Anaerotruncus sp. TaxID=1872531 RepID=UPI0025C3CD33|nr:hypothetical protein [Anaerotruncus sp.]